MKTNYHTHCSHCDGTGNPESIVLAAIEKNFDILGFSSHSPLPGADWTLTFDGVKEYVAEIRELKEKYRDKIRILVGMERDFLPSEPEWIFRKWEDLKLDYMIGSVHIIEREGMPQLYSVDGSVSELETLINEYFEGDARKMVEAYYDAVALMASRETMDFIGHFDLVKKQNKALGFLDEGASWYKDKVNSVLDIIAEKGQRIEINTGGISRGATDTVYPSQPILDECCRKGIPIVINSDSHHPDHLDFYFPQAKESARKAGYKEHWILTEKGWEPVPL